LHGSDFYVSSSQIHLLLGKNSGIALKPAKQNRFL